jgi:hypothetical protein
MRAGAGGGGQDWTARSETHMFGKKFGKLILF